jgi:hypothetical protein
MKNYKRSGRLLNAAVTSEIKEICRKSEHILCTETQMETVFFIIFPSRQRGNDSQIIFLAIWKIINFGNSDFP